ncbi:MAG: SPFH domain-containing protein, partial [Chloroflexota bacterium]
MGEVTVNLPAPAVRERSAYVLGGLPMCGGGLAALLGGIVLLIGGKTGGDAHDPLLRGIGVLLLLLGILALGGLTAVAPGQARVVQLFGHYSGSIRASGLHWVHPFARRLKISTRIRNHETTVAKVNDADGNPIEIAAVVVWRVADTAQAKFDVADYNRYVNIQSESALRHLASNYAYDLSEAAVEKDEVTLRGGGDAVSGALMRELQE